MSIMGSHIDVEVGRFTGSLDILCELLFEAFDPDIVSQLKPISIILHNQRTALHTTPMTWCDVKDDIARREFVHGFQKVGGGSVSIVCLIKRPRVSLTPNPIGSDAIRIASVKYEDRFQLLASLFGVLLRNGGVYDTLRSLNRFLSLFVSEFL